MIYDMILLMKRVTITLPDDVVDEIDRWETNRSRFVLEASLRELALRRREKLGRSLASPHPESFLVAEHGLEEWGAAAHGDDEHLLDADQARHVQWSPGRGWREDPE
jgi:Arc/MetJ-type ribon-helix-helix transcriptional regulator